MEILLEELLLPNGKYKCPYCDKECDKYGIKGHIWRVHGDGKNFKPTKGKVGLNKGRKVSQETREKLSKANKGKKWTDEQRKKQSELMKTIPNVGGYRPNSGKGKKFEYQGYWCDSSWELAFVVYNLNHKIKFKRNTEGFDYIYQNKTYKYYPDFIIYEDGKEQYIEIKNYDNERTLAKYKYFPYNLKVYYYNEMKIYLDYIEQTYGNLFYDKYSSKNRVIDIYEIECKIDYDYLYNEVIIQPLIKELMDSNIDFSKFGWVNKAAKILDKQPQKVNIWMKKYMPKFYEEKCFKKKLKRK